MSESLSIIVPAYNEAGRIVGSLQEIIRFARSRHTRTEIVVVDDGSTDHTAEVVEAARSELPLPKSDAEEPIELRLVQHPVNRGKGAAVRSGFQNSGGDILLFTDADLSAPITEASILLEPILRREYDIAIGSRNLDPSTIEQQQSLFRRTAGRIFNQMVRIISGLDIQDTQCGFKAFRRSTTAAIFTMQTIDGFAFDVELLYLAHRLGLQVVELPVRWSHAEGSKVSMVHHTREMAVDLLCIRWNDLRKRYPYARFLDTQKRTAGCGMPAAESCATSADKE